LKAHLVVIIVTALAAVTCGATFLLALFRQFGMVEVAASLGATAEVFFLSSAIGDVLEDKKQPNRGRFVAALGLAAAIVVYFLIMSFREPASG
jgi:FtsH-binding integral membrane protein